MTTHYIKKGFSLIEMLVTLLIVSVGMLALGSFYFSSINSESLSQQRLAAVHMAEQIIEDWQKDDVEPTPSCTLSDGTAAGQLVVGTTISSCTPNDGVSLPLDILITEGVAQAPVPRGHASHSGGTTHVEMANMLVDPTDATSGTIPLRIVKVSWTTKGQERFVLLTHIRQKQ